MRSLLCLLLLATPALANADPPDTDAPMAVVQPPTPVPVAAPALPDAAVLSTLGTGAYSAVQLAGSYAELLGHDALDEEHAKVSLGALRAGAGHQIAAIDAMLARDPKPDTSEDLRRLRGIFEGVTRQAEALQAFVAKPDASTGKAFRDARGETWTALVLALQLDEASAERLAPAGTELGKPKGH